MNKLAAILIVAVSLLWATAAFAQYSALGEDADTYGPAVGLTAIFLSGDDATGDSGSEALVGIDVAGINSMIAWNAFWATGSDASALGFSADYILAHNFDECGGCGNDGAWWFGVGPSIISVSDLFATGEGETASGVDFDSLGVNLGVGSVSEDWSFDLRAHYFFDESVIGIQGSANYNFN